MSNKLLISRSNVAGKRPTGKTAADAGELYVNFQDKVLGVIDTTGAALDLAIAPSVTEFDATKAYAKDVLVSKDGHIYRSIANTPAKPWAATDWDDITVKYDAIQAWAPAVNYVLNSLVTNGGKIYRAPAAVAAGIAFDATKWVKIADTFTAGSIPFAGATGALTEDNAGLNFRAAGKQLGIGAIPAATDPLLVVNSDAKINGVMVGKGAGTGTNNVAVGDSALAANTASSNTAVGSGALQTNTTGVGNSAVGSLAAYSNISGQFNVAVGSYALYSNTVSNQNTAVGNGALYLNTAAGNSALGNGALQNNTTGISNDAFGSGALNANQTGTGNAAFSSGALNRNTSDYNSAFGSSALSLNVSGSRNSGFGYQALLDNLASNNTAVGAQALQNNTTGTPNTAVGYNALQNNTTGNNNAALGINSGNDALITITTQSNNVVLGNNSTTTLYCKTSVISTSDVRDKIVYGEVPHGLEFVNALDTIQYQFRKERGSDEIAENEKMRYGFSAQHILGLEGDKPVIIDNRNEDKLFYDGSSLIPVLVNAIKELTAKVAELEAKVQ